MMEAATPRDNADQQHAHGGAAAIAQAAMSIPGSAALNVGAMMTPEPVTVAPDTPVRLVVELMRARNIGAVIVADGATPVGIFTERDYLRRCGSSDALPAPIREFMTSEPWTVTPDSSWQSALEVMQQRGIRHAPVVAGHALVGMLSVRDIVRHRTALLEELIQQRTAELVRQQAVVAERDRERTRSLEIAARIQRRLLPGDAPVVEPLELAFAFHPHDQVAGDYYDVQAIDPDSLLLVIGDASGHGVPAAFISVIAKTCIQTQLSSTTSPAALLGAMNEFLYGWVEPEHFISMFVATINRRTLAMTCARAGHPRPVLLRGDGSCAEIAVEGIMIGVLPEPDFPEQTIQLRPGDRLLLYTDGLTECTNAASELFGLHRVQEYLHAHRDASCRALLDGLVAEARGFTHGRGFSDDLTVVLLDTSRPSPVG